MWLCVLQQLCDGDVWKDVVYILKGLVWGIGVWKVVELCEKVEFFVSEGLVVECSIVLGDFKLVVDDVVQYIDGYFYEVKVL